MSVPVWQPGTLYLKGAVVKPTRLQPPAPASLTNGGFDSGDSGWTKGAGFTIETGNAFNGTYSAKYQAAPNTSAFIENDTDFTVTPGDRVTVSCMVDQGASSSGDAGGSVWIRWYDAGNNLLSGSEGNVISSGSNGEWHKSSVTATAPASAAYFHVAGECFLNGSGQPVYLDAFTLAYTPSNATGLSLIFKAVQDDPGTSAGTEPAWPSTLGVQVIDNTVTWEAIATGFVEWTAHAAMVTGTVEPTWPTGEGAFVTDGTVQWECLSPRVTDENCPNTKVVTIAASKVFAVDRDVIRFSATANPLDWTSEQDAGYLPSGLQQANANDMAVLNIYRGNLAGWNANCFQLWQVDPDPAQMAILDQMDGIGSTAPLAAQPVANDLLYLSQLGVRSVGIANAAENLAAGDVGSPIDVLVRSAMAGDVRPIATYYPGAGQYWLAFPATQPYTISITGDLQDAYVGDTGIYRYTIAGGLAPVTCAVTAGALPDGATIDNDGRVTYDYTTAGTFTWTITATGADGNTATVTDSAVITALPSVAYDVAGVPYKFMYSTDPDINTDFSGTAYDDSAWATGQGAFGSYTLDGAQTVHTPTDRGFDSRIWIRQTVAMAAGRDCLVEIWRDDGCQFWWNGVQYSVDPTADYYRVTVTIPGASVTGNDLAALRVTDGRNDSGGVAGSDAIYASMHFQTL